MGKSRPRQSFIPPTGFITDFALPLIFLPWAAIPQLDKQRGSIFLRPGSSMLLPKLLWVLSGPHHSYPLRGIREFTGPFPQISLMPRNGDLFFLIVTAMMLLFHEPQES
jgi:hypothetical protein